MDFLENLCRENSDFRDKLQVKLVGIVDDNVKKRIKDLNYLSERTEFIGYKSHSELTKIYTESDCLMLFLDNNKNSKGHIPGKLFEYMLVQKPILAIGRINSDVSKILDECGAGYICNFTDSKSIEELVLKLFNKELKLNFRKDKINLFSRKILTMNLINCFKRIS